MKLRHFFAVAVASVMALAACEEVVNLGMPSVTISTSEVTLAKEGGDATIKLTATRDWTVKMDDEAAAWLVVDPASGMASSLEQEVTVTALANDGYDREASIGFTIGMQTKYLTVKQEGSQGSADALVMYSNNFDKTKAEKGSNGWATYLDSFDGWMNATGTGLESVTYGFDRMTARTNSGNGSAGSYSDYGELGASGMNYLWFGSGAPYFAVKNIALPEGKTDFTLSFGTERYLYEAKDNTFNWDEFKVYVGVDGNKWVKPAFEFAGGKLPNGRWDLASATFTVPAGTTSLSVYFASSLASAYAIDDVKLVLSDAAGTVLDFANGEEFQVSDSTTGGGNTGGDDVVPESKGKKTVAEFIEAADKENYYELTGTVSGFNATYCSFDLTDDSGKIYVYSVLDASKSAWTSKISNGGTITIYGKYLYYEAKTQHEVVDAYIVSFEGDGSGSTETGKPESLVKATVAEFLAAAEDDTWYELTGEIISIAKQDYGNFTIKDETGEVYIYGMTSKWVGSNDKSFSQIGLKVGDTVTLGTRRGSYNGSPQGGGTPVPAYYISHVPGEGGGETPTPPSGEAGEYDSELVWTFGENAYDATSQTPQKAVVNGVMVENILKLGKSSAGGSATIAVPEGTAKVGFYAVAWKGNTGTVLTCSVGETSTQLNLKANDGATGNPDPTYEISVTEADYYTVDIPSGATSLVVSTTGTSNCRAIIFALKAITE